MKHVVSFSGGRTSAYLVHLMEQKRKAEGLDVAYVYMDTGAEHPKTYAFIRNVVKHFGIELICLRADFNQPLGVGHSYKVVSIDDCCHDLGPFRDMCKKYGTPSIAGKWCSSKMKQEVHDKYCDDVFGKSSYVTWLGIRADEPRRLTAIGKSEFVRYMAEISDAEKCDVMSFWASMPFDLEIDEWLGNCVFCFKKSDLKLAAAQRDEPGLYASWLQMIDGAPERVEQSKFRRSRHVMYRKRMRLEQVIAQFDGATGEEIKARIRGAKMTYSGACSESCEVFNCQLDMFD